MRLILFSLAALFLYSGMAQAGWNIKQQADGSTVWVDEDSNQIPVGDSGLVVHVTDLSTSSTHFVISHREGKIVKIYGINNTTFTAQSEHPVVQVGIGNGNTLGLFTPISASPNNGVGHMALITDVIGVLTSFVPADASVDVSQGGVISVHTDGASTGTASGTFVIIIE